MISMVVPFWKRGSILRANLQQLKKLYPVLALEVLIVDDGSPEPAVIDDHYPWPVSVLRMPAKTQALNPCVPINFGVSRASGDKIVLTNPEVIHRTPILERMAAEVNRLQDGYVAAACQASNGVWYCHSRLMKSDKEMGRAPSPPGAGLHFCSMLSKELFETVGGFSEEYRDGQGYDDNDFLWKLHEAGAEFRILDACVTDHVDCERCDWPKGGHMRNRQIFENRWQT